MSVSVVLKNVCHTTAEGPHWDEKTNDLLFVDIDENIVHRWNSVTGKHWKKRYGIFDYVYPFKIADA